MQSGGVDLSIISRDISYLRQQVKPILRDTLMRGCQKKIIEMNRGFLITT